MRAFRQTLTALVLGVTFSGAAIAADPIAGDMTPQLDSLMATTTEATRQSLQMDVDFDVMVASHQLEAENSEAELVAEVSTAPAVSPVDDNNDA